MKLKTAPLCAAVVGQANAFEWRDTSIGYRYRTDFQEPYNGNNISKNIINLSHAGGYKYGNNFFNIDLLMSDGTDKNTQEAYIVYRHTLDFAKVTGTDIKFGPVRSLGLTAGFDWNTKNDPFYASRKRMLVLGPTVKFDVPGFLDVSLLALRESNQPRHSPSRHLQGARDADCRVGHSGGQHGPVVQGLHELHRVQGDQ